MCKMSPSLLFIQKTNRKAVSNSKGQKRQNIDNKKINCLPTYLLQSKYS